MTILSVSFLLVCAGFLVGTVTANPVPRENALVLILMDGFRWDYPGFDGMTAFKELQTTGVHAEYMEPIMPSLSFPNYYSLATGLYPESHGMVGNIMYDKVHNELFMMKPIENISQPFWWEGAEPIWTTATKQNLSVSMFRWPGCQVDFAGVKPYKCIQYTKIEGVDEFRNDLNRTLTEIRDKGVRLGMVYVEHSDYVGHYKGPNSQDLRTAITDLDGVLKEFIDTIKQDQFNNVNMIVVSDHGMQDTTPDNITEIELGAILDMSDIKYILDTRAYLGIIPMEGKLKKVYNVLKNVSGIDVYKKDDIPVRYRLKNHDRIPPILVTARKGYYIEGVEGTDKQVPPEDPSKDADDDNDGVDDNDPDNFNGTHGYDPINVEDMRGIFYAYGPAFKDGYTGKPVSIVDIYNVMTNILDIEGKPNNGTWDNVKDYVN